MTLTPETQQLPVVPFRNLSLTVLLVVLAGCASAPAPQSTQPSPDTEPAIESSAPSAPSTPEEPAARTSSGENATLALVQQSQRAEAAGSVTEAIAYAERAIRINPRAPDLWLRLAELELSNGQPESTIQYANKALSLIETRADWQRQAWLLIADAHATMGEVSKADSIRARWRSYRG